MIFDSARLVFADRIPGRTPGSGDEAAGHEGRNHTQDRLCLVLSPQESSLGGTLDELHSTRIVQVQQSLEGLRMFAIRRSEISRREPAMLARLQSSPEDATVSKPAGCIPPTRLGGRSGFARIPWPARGRSG